MVCVRPRPAAALLAAMLGAIAGGCACGRGLFARDGGPLDAPGLDALDAGVPARDATRMPEAGPVDAPVTLDPDAACAASRAEVAVERLPVDIVWVVDNSASMAPAIDQVRVGLNGFAERIAASGLDYRVILLSLRGRTPIAGRYPICIPPPLAGPDCADAERFFHVDVDIRSTQPIEQILGTLAQTPGYLDGDAIGSAPWRHLLREGATKTIVVVTDDNARTCARPAGTCAPADPPLTETSLEDFPGGPNPFNSRTLGPGLRTAAYGSLFEGYTFDAIYGWGSETDPDVRCTYADGSMPPSPGWTYTTLVARTGGVRARICDGAAAWDPFFAAVASGVLRTARIACELDLPSPPDGSVLNPRRVNVEIRGRSGSTTVPYAGSVDGCDPARGGWHYDDAAAPSRVILCAASCDLARTETARGGAIEVLFGCDSIPI